MWDFKEKMELRRRIMNENREYMESTGKYANQQVYVQGYRTVLLCQDIDDIIPDPLDDRKAAVSEFKFEGANMARLEEMVRRRASEVRGVSPGVLRGTSLNALIGGLYHYCSDVQDYFMTDRFRKDCRRAGVRYTYTRKDYVFAVPGEKGEEQEFLRWLRNRRFVVPDGYRPRGFQSEQDPGKYVFWPNRLDLSSRTVMLISGITGAAGAASGNVIMPWEDLKLFDI